MDIQDQLKKLYIDNRLSILDCSEKLGISATKVKYYLSRFQIKRNQYTKIDGTSEDRICTKCKTLKNVSEFYFQSYKTSDRKSRQGSWCKSCMSKQVIERQRKYKQQAVDYKGGKCQNCGYSKYLGALEFHHLDPTQKDFEMSKFTKSPLGDFAKEELNKCILLCANCHREAHETKV